MYKVKPFIARLAGASTLALAMVGTTLAAQIPTSNVSPTGSVTGSFDLSTFFKTAVQSAVNIVFFLAAAASIAYLIWGGVKYITAGGDPKKAGEARQAIINAVIGVAVIVGAYTLINIAFGINNAVIATSTASSFSN